MRALIALALAAGLATSAASARMADRRPRASAAPLPPERISLQTVRPEELQALREPSGRTRLINFWATWCPPCREEFPELMKIADKYRTQPFELVTVSINSADEDKSVRAYLETHRATSRNLLNAFMTPDALMKAFDPEWTGAIPFTVVLGPDGKELYAKVGSLDVVKVRRVLLASFPNDRHAGLQPYWNNR